MALYKIHSVGIFTDAMGSAVNLSDVLSQDLQLDPELRAEVTAGNVSPTHVALVARRCMLNAATYDLANFLDTVGVSGLCVTGATNYGVRTFLEKFDDCGVATGSGNRSFTYKNGILVPKTLSVSHQQDARLTFDMVCLGDGGTNDPVVISDSATLPTLSANGARWTLGPITVCGIALTEYSSLEIDFGNNIETRGVESDIDATHVEMRTHAPTIRIMGISPTWFSGSNIPIGGKAVTNAADKIFLRKRSQTVAGGFVADGTSGHIKLVPAGLAAISKAGGAEMQRASETEIRIVCSKDSSGNNPIVVTTGTTIA